MAFGTPKSDIELVKKAIAEQFPREEHDDIWAMLAPSAAGGSRVPLCILQLARGNKELLIHYAECARTDFRDVIYWAERPDEAALDTPEKIEDFQELLEWAGQSRDSSLELEKLRLEATRLNQDSANKRAWWKLW